MWRPLLHFLWIGGLLFAAARALAPGPPPDPVVIPAQRVEGLRAGFLARSGRLPDERELAALLRAEVDEELLYRRARALGFDRDDPVVQRRLVQNMRFAGAEPERDDASLYAEALDLGMDESDPVVRRRLVQRMRLAVEARALLPEPGEQALREHYERSRERYATPARVRLVQLYFDGEPEGEALRALEALAGRDADEAGDLGDAFLHAPRQPLQTERELAARFGGAFAEGAYAAAPGRWSGPVPSSYGQHLVYVQQREPASQRPFEQVRDPVRLALLAERRRAALAETLASLRAGTAVVVAGELR